MARIKLCDGCIELNRRKKTEPCNKGFNCVYNAETKQFIRPNKCKTKFQKIDPRKELNKIKKEAVDSFQTWVRYRDNFTCCCCGKKVDKNSPEARKLMHPGHFVSRKIEWLLLDPLNCHAQCRECNGFQDWFGVQPNYFIYLYKKYGLGVFEYLSKRIKEYFSVTKEQRKYTPEQWEKLRDYWKEKLEQIKNQKDA